MKKFDMTEFGITLVLASIVMLAVGFVMGSVPLGEHQMLITSIILLVALLFVAPSAKLDNTNWFNALVLFLAIGIVGLIVGTIAPAFSVYVLSFSAMGELGGMSFFFVIGWVVLYWMIGETLRRKLM